MKIEITDINAPELDLFRLSESELNHIYEPEPGLFIAESPKVIERALNDDYEPVKMLVSARDYVGEAAEVIKKCEQVYAGVAKANNACFPVYTAPEEVLDQITGYKLIRGAICIMKRKFSTNRHVRYEEGKKLEKLKEMLCDFSRIAVLENVTNPTNLGAIFRSAAALGIDAVLLTPGCADPLYRRTLRVGMGTIFQIPWTYVGESLEDWEKYGIDLLHELGFSTAAMALEDESVGIDDKRLAAEEKLAVILGNEGNGLCRNTIQKSDYTVLIPMAEGVDSLNVAAASAVAFWELGH